MQEKSLLNGWSDGKVRKIPEGQDKKENLTGVVREESGVCYGAIFLVPGCPRPGLYKQRWDLGQSRVEGGKILPEERIDKELMKKLMCWSQPLSYGGAGRRDEVPLRIPNH